jgi:predicted outer membrane repeat protein
MSGCSAGQLDVSSPERGGEQAGPTGSSEDCDRESVWFLDADGDGWGDAPTALWGCEAPGDHVPLAGDCDDQDAAVHPAADEVCDGLDNDCDALADELDDSLDLASAVTSYVDADGDGFGTELDAVTRCEPVEGRVLVAGDCDEGDRDVNPSASEVCDGVDNDCDGQVDDSDADLDLSTATAWYADLDQDGHGDPDDAIWVCEEPRWRVASGHDCDDSSDAVHPDAPELCDGWVDEDCDGEIDELGALGQLELYVDADGDGFGAAPSLGWACFASPGHALMGGDCDDAVAEVHPGALDTCDGVDHDCTGDEAGVISAEGEVFATLAEAVASGTGWVDVCPGTYGVELVLNTGLTLNAPYGPDLTVLKGLGSSSLIQVLDWVALTVDGFTLTGGVGSESPFFAGSAGGAIQAAEGGPLTVRNCVIEGNTADHGGGILGNYGSLYWLWGGDLIEDTVLRDNVALEGGAAYLYKGTLRNTALEGNSASEGAGVFVTWGEVALVDVTASGNVAGLYGGAVHSEDALIEIDGGRFEANEAFVGGAIHGDVLVDIVGATLAANTANTGGAVAMRSGTLTSLDTVFEGNVATFSGSAISMEYGESVNLTSGEVRDNRSDGLGAVVSHSTDVVLDGVVVAGNTAGSVGAGLYVVGAEVALVEMTLSNNAAEDFGGGAFLSLCDVSATKSTIRDNTAATLGAGLYLSDSDVALESSAVDGNAAGDRGGGVWMQRSSLSCEACDWGLAAEANTPEDVWVEGLGVGYADLGHGTMACDEGGCR